MTCARRAIALFSTVAFAACAAPASDRATAAAPPASYYDTPATPTSTAAARGMIAVTTPKGTFHVWTKRIGNNPRIKLLLLHGGPGATHEYFEPADMHLPAAGIEYYYYDQLGSFYSDQPKDSSLWRTERFVEEVEQVRKALGMDSTNFFLLGHSWGGILATEYALKYQKNLKGLIISNMMSSIPAYEEYAEKVLEPAMDQKVLAEVKALEAKKKYADPRYMELLIPAHYEKHILRTAVRGVARPRDSRLQAHQRRHLHPHAGAERARREREAREVGPQRRPQEHHRADTRDRRHLRHDGSQAHGVDVEAVPQGAGSCSVRTPATWRCTTTARSISAG